MTVAQSIALYVAENPYVSTEARANSSYSGFARGEVVRLLDWRRPSGRLRSVHRAFRRMAGDPAYPCVGARSVVSAERYRLGAYGVLGSAGATEGLARDLSAFIAEQPAQGHQFTTYLAAFSEVRSLDEIEFEKAVWRQLQALHKLDKEHQAWDPTVSSNPADPDFSFSFGGHAFFVIGMHPQSSRLARRFPWPALAFNAHAQFRELRRRGTYRTFVEAVRKRDMALQGTLNPNLAEFGKDSEARQYSGREVEPDWECPFQP